MGRNVQWMEGKPLLFISDSQMGMSSACFEG